MLVLAGVIALLHPSAAAAQADPAAGYPKAPVKMIVGLAPGGSNDIIARVVAQKLSERLGQAFIVENKPGAGGTIAAEYVAHAAPDGLTLLVAPSGSMTVNPATYSHLPYDPLKSYDLIGNMALYQLVALERIVRQVRVGGRIDRHRSGRRDEQRETVRRRVRHILGRDRAASARLVLDDECLAEALRQFLRNDPRDDVVRAARRETYDHLDRRLGIAGSGVRLRGGRARMQQRDRAGEHEHCRPNRLQKS